MRITAIGQQNISGFMPLLGQAPSPGEFALGAIVDKRPAGVIVFSVKDEVCYVEHLLVTEENRRKGIGTFLLADVDSFGREIGAGSMMAFFAEDDMAKFFFESQGFFLAPTDPLFSFRGSDILNAPIAEKAIRLPKNVTVKRMDEVSNGIRNALVNGVSQNGFDSSLMDRGGYDDDISLCCVRDDVPTALILAKRHGGDAYVSLLLSLSEDSWAVPRLAAHFFKNVSDRIGGDARILCLERDQKLIGQLRGMVEGLEVEVIGRSWSACKA